MANSVGAQGAAAPARRRIAFLISGTRGDNQPFVPLCRQLSRLAHVQVWLSGKRNQELFGGFGIEARLMESVPDIEALFNSHPLIKELFAKGELLSVHSRLKSEFEKMWPAAFDEIESLHHSFQPELLVYMNLTHPIAQWLHDTRGVAVCLVQLFPRMPTARAPPVYMIASGMSLPCGCNRILHRKALALQFVGHLEEASELQRRRRKAGLPPLTAAALESFLLESPTVCAWSGSVFAGYSDWPRVTEYVGYWALTQEEQLRAFGASPELRGFLDQGPPPVYIGWGSMIAGSAEWMT